MSDWVERNFFSLIVFGRNLLPDDVHSSVTMDRHVQTWQWIDSISLLTWGLLSASACSLEACNDSLTFLLLTSKSLNTGTPGKSTKTVTDDCYEYPKKPAKTSELKDQRKTSIETTNHFLSYHSMKMQLI